MYSLRRATVNDLNKLIAFRVEFLKEVQDYPLDEEFKEFRNFFKISK